MSTIYVATSWHNQDQKGVVAELRRLGHIVYDFKGRGSGYGFKEDKDSDVAGFGWSQVNPDCKVLQEDIPAYLNCLRHPVAQGGFRRDMEALKECDACIMLQPCGSSASMEFGYAVGAGKKTAIYIPTMREPELMILMADLITTNLQDIFNFLGPTKTASLSSH